MPRVRPPATGSLEARSVLGCRPVPASAATRTGGGGGGYPYRPIFDGEPDIGLETAADDRVEVGLWRARYSM